MPAAGSALVDPPTAPAVTRNRASIVPLRRVPGRAAVARSDDPLPRSEELRQQLLFADLSHSQLARVRDTGRLVELEPGQVLYERGQVAHHFYLVLEGQVNLALHSRGGEEKIVEIIGAGQVFAEAVMFLEEVTYQLTSVAAVRTRLVRFDNATYLATLAENPATCLRMLGHMSRRLHGRIRDIEHLSFEGATHRLVRALLARLPSQEGPLELRLAESRQELAAYLSMKPETLSRSLRALAQTGVLDVEGRTIRVPSRRRLLAELDAVV